jgi:small GTP-binding protein
VDTKLQYATINSGLFLADNPIQKPPLEIIRKGKQAVLEYFKSITLEETKTVNEFKVLFLGEGGAGKTSLMNVLLGKTFSPTEQRTDGINLDSYIFQEHDKQITANLWDFGGQEIMHSTHQFFLTKRSMYILVLDGRRHEKPEYWLQMIEAFGDDSPIIVVLNKMDENPSFEVNRENLQRKYKGISSFHRVSCYNGEGVADVKNAIIKNIGNVEILRTELAKSWIDVKSNLENMTQHYINARQYENLCQEQGVKKEKQQTVLVELLHDLGTVLHFGECGLNHMYVLEPLWATDGVYPIINSRELAESKGILDLSMLKQILDRDKYPIDTHAYIIELMKKFELCYYISQLNIDELQAIAFEVLEDYAVNVGGSDLRAFATKLVVETKKKYSIPALLNAARKLYPDFQC